MVKTKRKTLRVAGAILVVVVAFVLAFNSIVAKLIERKIDAFLLGEKLKHYHVQYNRAGFNFLNRSVSLIGFKLIPDSVFLDSIAKTKINTAVMEFSVGRITVAGIDFGALLKGEALTVRKVTVRKPEMKLYKFNGKVRTAEKASNRTGFLGDSVFLAKLSHKIEIKRILLKKTRLVIYNYNQHKTTLSSDRITIMASGLILAPSGHGNHYFYPSVETVLLVAKDNYIALSNPLYEIKFKELTVDLTHNAMHFKGFHYLSPYSKKNFSKHIKFQKERFDFYAGTVDFSGIDTYRFLLKNEIHIRKIIVSDAVIDLFRDKNVPFNHAQRPLLPNQSLKRMKGKFKIDSVLIRNVHFAYAEQIPGRSHLLQVSFSYLSGYLVHLSDMASLWKKYPMQVDLEGRFMKRAPFHIRFVFPLWVKSDTFSFQGSIKGPVPFKIFNPAVFPASGLKFTGGTLTRMTFRGNANPRYATGTMTMLYHDMSFEAMKKKNSNSANKFISWGVNSFVRRNNPRKGKDKEVKSVSMFFQRDMEKGFGNLLWKTLFSGMKATMIPSVNTINRRNIQAVAPDKKEAKAQVKKTGR
jgi:hypothetical protein